MGQARKALVMKRGPGVANVPEWPELLLFVLELAQAAKAEFHTNTHVQETVILCEREDHVRLF